MTGLSQLDNKVSLQDIDVDQYKIENSNAASGNIAEPQTGDQHGTIRVMGSGRYMITFKIDNSATTFNLNADKRTFADWGSFSGAPSNVLAKHVDNDVCNVSEDYGFWTGAAGMIGYSITSRNQTVYLRLAATDPYWSRRDNRSMVAIYSKNEDIDQGVYNSIYSFSDYAKIDFNGKELKVQGDVGTANSFTAKFTITWE